jgi:hypothetical protein
LRVRARLAEGFLRCPRIPAPVELAERVAQELTGDRSRRLERVLQSVVRRPAPTLLDECVGDGFLRRPAPDEQRGSQKAEALRSLDVHSAPEVLERLLNEELADPVRQAVERFPGNLERLEAPRELEKLIGSTVRRRALARLLVGPTMALAAACLVVWMAARSGVPEPRTYRFNVVHARSFEDLDPMARVLAESLGGGVPQ